LRREYLYRKSLEGRQKAIQDKKDRLRLALDGKILIIVIFSEKKFNNYFSTEGRPIDTDLKRQAIELQKSLEWEDAGPERAALLSGTDTGKQFA
jgi:U3 small nucleolar ribonucleoprotein protein IMP4